MPPIYRPLVVTKRSCFTNPLTPALHSSFFSTLSSASFFPLHSSPLQPSPYHSRLTRHFQSLSRRSPLDPRLPSNLPYCSHPPLFTSASSTPPPSLLPPNSALHPEHSKHVLSHLTPFFSYKTYYIHTYKTYYNAYEIYYNTWNIYYNIYKLFANCTGIV